MAKLTDKQHKFVAAYLGPARLNGSKAARMAGYSAKTAGVQAFELLKKPEIQEAIAEWREQIRKEGIADQTFRIERLNELDSRYWSLIEARAKEYANVPGGDSGLIVRQFKPDGQGGYLTEYVADTAITKEIRDLQKQMAQELGEWTEKKSIEGTLTLADLAVAALTDESTTGDRPAASEE